MRRFYVYKLEEGTQELDTLLDHFETEEEAMNFLKTTSLTMGVDVEVIEDNDGE
jgi:hypothetical protein